MTTIAASPAEHLEDGHSPGTPAGDNLQLDYARAEAAAFAATTRSGGGRLARSERFGIQLCDLGAGSPFGNVALLEQPCDAASTADLASELGRFYDGHQGGPYMVFSPWPIDLGPHGFKPVGHPPLMLRPAGGRAPLADGLHIERVVDREGLADFERTAVEAYPIPEMQPWRLGALLGPAVLETDWTFFVGYHGGRPVATSAAYVSERLSVVELVSTRPEVRGRGFGATITAAAHLAAPDRPSMLIASDLGRPAYDRLGYLPILRYTLWLGTRRSAG
jgi:hypothetical protein